ncbi:MAG: TetR/AcrR family transcriptional regulator [Sandaracinaceae bacterium]
MPAPHTEQDVVERRARVLVAARWCFLNFGFAKTSLEDIARRAGLSRTLLYRMFAGKEEILTAVFEDWLIARHPAAREAAEGRGSAADRLMRVCRLLAIEPWAEMAKATMGGEFHEVCERFTPESEAHYRKMMCDCVATVLGDEESAEVFVLALDGQFTDRPSAEVLEQRTQLLAARFAKRTSNRRTARNRS